ncbi:hypothetical protein HS088_TW02G00940 [Tripterygium wilfordii]|uniref:adenylate dimethylallyltransferase (ADP/ATP-dependent) n=1 Tax=Tripterygium wilfordii TaxID=458696 RepID=A0A7J7E062_TRIWF|nr:adenylate isopentenyltransferase-like [Tripterygium wilfordii]XP_038713215.1 adenylate isopentenyltransferase-like [Tripterygium wilfordii]KAF5751921.1 hypothetical protein HS088_TW02G00940 [Tripterygium wilfordii]
MRILPLLTTHQQYYSPTKLPSLSFPSGPPFECLRRPSRWVPPRMDSSVSPVPRKDKVVVLMGATGSGKSSLSIDLATLFPSEVVNSDKMQVYDGLDITTNKISIPDRRNVPHHLLGEIDPEDGEFNPSDFRSFGGSAIAGIVSRRKLPLIVGGSNSFIHSLIVEQFNPDDDVFTDLNSKSISTEFRYNCCFIWVDVSFPVLCNYLAERVDEMLDLGMFEELAEFYNPDRIKTPTETGLRKAIGVPEFDRYFSKYPPMTEPKEDDWEWRRMRREAYDEAVREIKENTFQLVKRQLRKIQKLRGAGWDLHRVDATMAFREVLMTSDRNRKQRLKPENQKKKKSRRWIDIWNKDVLQPTMKIVKQFFEEEE